jgi:hypothetical protein
VPRPPCEPVFVAVDDPDTVGRTVAVFPDAVVKASQLVELRETDN